MERTCSIADCPNPVLARGWCRRHYEAWRRSGDPLKVRKKPGVCTVPGCTRPTVGQGLCRPHYEQAWKARKRASRPTLDRWCARCGEAIPVTRNSRAIYCSPRCKARGVGVKTNRRWRLKHEFGMTEGDFEAMLAQQGGTCAICHRTEPNGRGTWHIDHDHQTGRTRGLLCHSCNLALGYLKDDLTVLQSAMDYLRR